MLVPLYFTGRVHGSHVSRIHAKVAGSPQHLAVEGLPPRSRFTVSELVTACTALHRHKCSLGHTMTFNFVRAVCLFPGQWHDGYGETYSGRRTREHVRVAFMAIAPPPYRRVNLNRSSPCGAYMNVTLYSSGLWWYSRRYDRISWKQKPMHAVNTKYMW